MVRIHHLPPSPNRDACLPLHQIVVPLRIVNVDETKPPSDPNPGLAKRLRRIGVTAFLMGLLCAGLVYWRGRGPTDIANDPSMGGFNKASQRQMELMYGKMGTITEDLVQHLKRPGTQAAIIAIGGALIAVGCFYFARLVSYGGEVDTNPSE